MTFQMKMFHKPMAIKNTENPYLSKKKMKKRHNYRGKQSEDK